MKTLADLKRQITLGTKLTLVDTNNTHHKYLGTTREVSAVQTNGIYLGTPPSWLEWPKASKVVIKNDTTFRLVYPDHHLEYRIEA